MDELFKQLVVPLLGGFLFIWSNHKFRFLLLPAGGEKFFLACGVLGAFGLLGGTLIAHAVKMLCESCPVLYVQELHLRWREWIPFSPAQVIAFVGLPVIGLLLNRRCDPTTAYSFAVATAGDTLEVFFERAVTESKLILLSLHSGRVYVGKIEDTLRPLAGRRHIKIVPFMSGFRWPLETQSDGAKSPNRIHWSTLYRDTVKGILSAGQTALGANSKKPPTIKIPGPTGRSVDIDASEMGIVIAIDDIESATIFNQRVYAYLNRDRYPYILDRFSPTKGNRGQQPGDAPDDKSAQEAEE